MEVQVGVDPVLFQVEDKPVQFIELFFIEIRHVLGPYSAGSGPHVHVMETDDVVSHSFHPDGDPRSNILTGKAGSKGHIGAEKADPLSGAICKMPVLY